MTLKTRAAVVRMTISFLLCAPLSLAQMDMGTGMPVMDWIGPMVDSQRFGALLRNNLDLDNPAPPIPKPSTASLPYSLTAALKKATVQGYIDRLKAKNPLASRMITDNFGSGKYDYADIYSGLVKGNGLKDNDAVAVMTAYLVLGYMIVNNIQDGATVTPKMVQAVKAQFGPGLAQNAQLKAPGKAAQLGEEMKLQTVVVQGGWQAALKEKTLPAYQQGIGTMFKTQWGLDFKALRLTTTGFTKR